MQDTENHSELSEQNNSIPDWLKWARRIQSIVQAGLTYSNNSYDLERYEMLREIAAEMIAFGAHDNFERVIGLLKNENGYTTPKLDARGVIINEGKILLVCESADGGWTLPGGWVDVNESPSTAVAREVWEESGYEVKVTKLLALYDRDLHGHPPILFHTYKIFFRCELTGGSPKTSLETTGVDFFTEDSLPPLSISRTTADEIHHMFEHARHPAWPTSFD